MTWSKANLAFETIQQRQLLAKLASSIQMFAEFSQDEIIEFIRHADKSVFKAGNLIIREGEPGLFMYIIVSGSAKIVKQVDDREECLTVLSSGEAFGEMALIDNMERSASVKAISDCTLLRISASSVREMPTVGTKTYRNIAMLLAQRLRYSNSLASLLLHKLPNPNENTA